MDNKEKWMQYALKEAEKALKDDEVPIGAIVVKDDRIIGRGFNKTESLNDCTAHAEVIAITSAANSLEDWRLNDSYMYVTKEPCLMCFGAVINSRISRLYYGLKDSKSGFSVIVNSKEYNYKHLELIESDILEFDCKYIIQNFFKNKRTKSIK